MTEPVFQLPPDWRITPAVLPLAEKVSWANDFVGISEAWKITKGKGVKVCILDTGCDLHHPDLRSGIVEAVDFTRSPYGPQDRAGHGTWCAGAIGARGRIEGIAPECSLMIGKVLGDNGAGDEEGIYSGLMWALNNGADIVSMSLGGPRMSRTMHELIIRFVSRRQKWIFAASGNDGTYNRMGYPAGWKETISVGAVDKEGRRAKFSNAGDNLDIVAPGVDTLSTIPLRDGGYGSMSGTSMATPIVAGVAALALAKHRAAGGESGLDTLDDMREHLRKSATDTGAPGHDPETGAGIINAPRLLSRISKDADLPQAGEASITIPFPMLGYKTLTLIFSP